MDWFTFQFGDFTMSILSIDAETNGLIYIPIWWFYYFMEYMVSLVYGVNLHSNLVILLLDNNQEHSITGDLFTFQFGDFTIRRVKNAPRRSPKFTFQFGDFTIIDLYLLWM